MARFDVFETVNGSYVLDCQTDFLDYLGTRFVLPLLPPELEPKFAERLNPVFIIGEQRYVLYPQFAASLSKHELGSYVMSLAKEHLKILNALDMLITGY